MICSIIKVTKEICITFFAIERLIKFFLKLLKMYMGKSYNYLVFDNDPKNPNNMRIRMQITEICVMSFNKLFTHLFSFDKFYLFYIS